MSVSAARGWLLLVALSVISPTVVEAAPPSASTATITQSELLAGLRAMPGLQARYREEKIFGLLAAPLVSEGTVHFVRPRGFARHQTAPFAASMVVDGNTMKFGDRDGKEEIDLGQHAVVRLFVGGFLDLLSGNEQGLTDLYHVEFKAGLTADPRSWRITLRPKVEPIVHLVDRIVVEGLDTVVRRMEVHEKTGDSTITTFQAVDVRRTYDAAEKARIFRLP